jgi:hypothetical protein
MDTYAVTNELSETVYGAVEAYTIDEGATLTPDGADMLGLPRCASNGFELPARDLGDLRDGLLAVVDEEATE